MQSEIKKKSIKTFWAITSVLVAAVIAGGIIYFNVYSSMIQDDIYSISFSSPIQIHKAESARHTTMGKTSTIAPVVKK